METQTNTHDKTITFYVNGEAQQTDQHKLTVRAILVDGGFTPPPEDYRLSCGRPLDVRHRRVAYWSHE